MTLTVSSIGCDRSDRRILQDFSLTCEKGRAVLLRGPNGAGKSTLLRALAGLLPLSAGQVDWDGTDLATDRDAFQEKLAYAGHLDAVKPALTVAENLGFWADITGGGSVRDALLAFDLETLSERPAGACSAGQKRRVGLARLMLADRPLWLLDEPTVSLDAENTAAFEKVLEAHLANGGAAVIASHIAIASERAEVCQMTPLLMVMADGTDDPFLEGAF